MPVTRVDHVQLAMPPGREAAARAFYEGVLDIPEIAKPLHLAARGGCWFERGALRVHLGVDSAFVPARKAHPAFVTDDLDRLTATLTTHGHHVTKDQLLDGFDRVYVEDPFGNRIELMQPTHGT
jgi:catechol 2,3-dioxygenase-like lactoylglutathione lyase family enzyme